MQLTNLLDKGKKTWQHTHTPTLLQLCYYLCLCCSFFFSLSSYIFLSFLCFLRSFEAFLSIKFMHTFCVCVCVRTAIKSANACSHWNHPVVPPCWEPLRRTTLKRFESLNALLTNHIAQIKAAAMWLENSL